MERAAAERTRFVDRAAPVGGEQRAGIRARPARLIIETHDPLDVRGEAITKCRQILAWERAPHVARRGHDLRGRSRRRARDNSSSNLQRRRGSSAGARVSACAKPIVDGRMRARGRGLEALREAAGISACRRRRMATIRLASTRGSYAHGGRQGPRGPARRDQSTAHRRRGSCGWPLPLGMPDSHPPDRAGRDRARGGSGGSMRSTIFLGLFCGGFWCVDASERRLRRQNETGTGGTGQRHDQPGRAVARA